MQAVILAGGLGTRLKPLSDNVPKPMVRVAGKPFLEFILIQLRNAGISEILILSGYLGNQIEEYFGDGKSLGLSIEYSLGNPQLSKKERILNATGQLQEKFILLYSDNYAQFDFKKLLESGDSWKLTLARKNPGNVILDPATSKVLQFNWNLRLDASDYVEIGYMFVKKKLLVELLHQSKDLDEAISIAASQGMVTAHVIPGPYLSISDPDRWAQTNTVFQNKKIVFLDRDGLINRKAPIAQYIETPEKIEYLKENIEFLRILAQEGYRFIVISNQAGVGRGFLTKNDLVRINEKIKSDLQEEGIEILEFFVCTHGWDDGCVCRKPEPGLFFEAAEKFQIVLNQCTYFGDDVRDAQAGNNAGTLAVLLDEDSSDLNSGISDNRIVVKSLLDEKTRIIESMSRREEYGR